MSAEGAGSVTCLVLAPVLLPPTAAVLWILEKYGIESKVKRV